MEDIKERLTQSLVASALGADVQADTTDEKKNEDFVDGVYDEDDEVKRYYISTDDVKMTNEGTYVKTKFSWYSVAKFPFMIRHLIRTANDEVYRIVQIGNDKDLELDEPIYLKVANRDFASAAKFRSAIYKHQKMFKGKDDGLNEILEAMPPVDESIYVEKLGWNAEAHAYFFSNVAIRDGEVLTPDVFGLVKCGDISFFMPYVDSITGGVAKDDVADSFQYFENKEMTFNKWFQLLLDAHKHYCILPTCFMIASIFRDILFDELKFMPILYVKGVRGSGKSSIIRNLTAVFGKPQKEVSLKGNQNTPKSMARMLNQKSNSMVWLDEYHNDIVGNVQGMLQSMYDGAGYQKASFSNDNKVDSVDVQSSLVLTSNYLPENEIFFTRTILVQANETNKTSEQREAFKRLIEIERGGLSCICAELLKYRKLIEKRFKSTYDALFEYFFNRLPGIDTRFLDNMAGILAPAMILLDEKKINMVHLDYMDDLCAMAAQNIQEQFNLLEETNVTLEFWNIIQILYDRGVIKKGQDLKLLNDTRDDGKTYYDEFVALRLGRLYVPYAKEAGNRAKSQQEISENIIHSEFFVCKKDVRFLSEGDTLDDKRSWTNPTSSLILNYPLLKQKLGVTF
ncbi:MAG: hypothetical protein IKP73_04230 [Bacteroidales bacterium]|nr:hypothetical protein [Bacteroidales bacterium]